MFTTHRVRLGVLFIGACSVGIAGASAQCVKDWIGGEPLPGVNGAVGASLVWDQDGPGGSPPVLVVGGDFTFAGMVSAQRIAAWDGTTWSNPFGGGLNGPVRALAVFNGDLIAAGEFTRAGGDGGPPASSIARWTGAAWVPLGSGIAGSVNALAVFNGRLYAGGIFGSAGGVPATDLASWDGAAWWGVGVSGVDGTVYALSAFNNALYVAGQLTHADGAATSGIARWDGATWSAVGSGVAPADVRSLLVDGGDLYAGGGFTNAGGQTAYGVARWDGSAWSAAGQGLYHRTCIRYSCVNHVLPVRQLARFGSLIYAVIDPGSGGAVQMFKFNGASWTASATLSTVSAEPWATATLTAFNDALYLGGNFAGGTAPPNFAGFDGTQWELSPGINGPINGLTPYANGLAAVGGFTQIDGVPQNHVALWDGAAWHALGDGISIEGHSIAALGGNLYVGAWPGGVYQWDGSTWQTLYGAGAFSGPPTVSTWNNQVIAGAPFAGFGSNGEESDPSAVAAWNGTAWVPLGHAASVATGPGAFASLGASLYAAGYFGPTASIGRFHGAAEWQAVDTFAIGSPPPSLRTTARCTARRRPTPGLESWHGSTGRPGSNSAASSTLPRRLWRVQTASSTRSVISRRSTGLQ